MLSPLISDAFVEQVQAELYSAHLYLSMSVYFQGEGLSGFSHWMRIQYQEETAHALKFVDYLMARGTRFSLPSVEEPPSVWDNSVDVFEATLEHEQMVTRRINNLVHLVREERDFASDIFLNWFVSEQVEEEENVSDILGKLRLINGEGQGLLMMDKELSVRVFVPPPAN